MIGARKLAVPQPPRAAAEHGAAMDEASCTHTRSPRKRLVVSDHIHVAVVHGNIKCKVQMVDVLHTERMEGNFQ